MHDHFQPTTSRPDDFDAYWSRTMEALDATPMAPEAEVMPIRCTDFLNDIRCAFHGHRAVPAVRLSEYPPRGGSISGTGVFHASAECGGAASAGRRNRKAGPFPGFRDGGTGTTQRRRTLFRVVPRAVRGRHRRPRGLRPARYRGRLLPCDGLCAHPPGSGPETNRGDRTERDAAACRGATRRNDARCRFPVLLLWHDGPGGGNGQLSAGRRSTSTCASSLTAATGSHARFPISTPCFLFRGSQCRPCSGAAGGCSGRWSTPCRAPRRSATRSTPATRMASFRSVGSRAIWD